MARKRVTQLFPWLLPLRRKQRLLFFYAKMRLDGNRYATRRTDELLPHRLFETSCPLYNRQTGFPMVYQENKVFNLKLAAAPIRGLIIRPGETFSFWQLVRHADRHTPYRDGLVTVNGRLTAQKGGGLCQLSNLLFWMFLHSPLTVTERHGHGSKDFPEPPSDAPLGVDATVAEGWLDLRVRNDTQASFQIHLAFDADAIHGSLYTDRDDGLVYQIKNDHLLYRREEAGTFEEVDVVRRVVDRATGACVSEGRLYHNRCRIGYPLPPENADGADGQPREGVKTVAVLFGGCSPEYSVSLESAAAVIRHMDTSRYAPLPIGITQEGDWYRYTGAVDKIAADAWFNEADCIPCALSPSRSDRTLLIFHGESVEKMAVDAVFPVLHGKNGEDGTVQGLCELAGIPLVGCGTLASALCMDKDRAHRLVQAAGVRVPRCILLEKGSDAATLQQEADALGYPLFVKPVKAGSSYGVARVTAPGELPEAIARAFAYDGQVLVEEGIPGFEVGCAVMGNEEPITGEIDEIELAGGFFDYTEKYHLVSSRIHVPARISPAKAEELKRTAKTIYQALGCRGFARVDMFLTPDGDIVFNEVNTIPGFTAHSRFPGMMQAAGFSLTQVITRAIELGVAS